MCKWCQKHHMLATPLITLHPYTEEIRISRGLNKKGSLMRLWNLWNVILHPFLSIQDPSHSIRTLLVFSACTECLFPIWESTEANSTQKAWPAVWHVFVWIELVWRKLRLRPHFTVWLIFWEINVVLGKIFGGKNTTELPKSYLLGCKNKSIQFPLIETLQTSTQTTKNVGV